MKKIVVLILVLSLNGKLLSQSGNPIQCPAGKRVAISLTFDDARTTQVEGGTALLDKYNVKATFYVLPGGVKSRLAGWKKAVASGHEIGNHSFVHPCSGTFTWARSKALEDYTLDKMRQELVQANDSIQKFLGVRPTAFAYPCGQTYVGRGKDVKSYVPLISELFTSGRCYMNEVPNDPAYTDFAQLTGIEMDGKDFEQLLPIIENARTQGLWIILAGHEMSISGVQTTRLAMLEKLIQYAQNPANGVWLAPVGEVASLIQGKRN